MKTIKDFGNVTTEGISYYTFEELKKAAMEILQEEKGDINTADWVEFFQIEKEFAIECINSTEKKE